MGEQLERCVSDSSVKRDRVIIIDAVDFSNDSLKQKVALYMWIKRDERRTLVGQKVKSDLADFSNIAERHVLPFIIDSKRWKKSPKGAMKEYSQSSLNSQ